MGTSEKKNQVKKIEGGFYIIARCMEDSEVASARPVVREVFGYLIRNACYEDTKHLKRGQLLVTYEKVIETLSWKSGYRTERYSKRQCGSAMEWLAERNMIRKTRTTRGVIITVCNYCIYQDIRNYGRSTESHAEVSRNAPEGPIIYNTINNKEINHDLLEPLRGSTGGGDEIFFSGNKERSEPSRIEGTTSPTADGPPEVLPIETHKNVRENGKETFTGDDMHDPKVVNPAGDEDLKAITPSDEPSTSQPNKDSGDDNSEAYDHTINAVGFEDFWKAYDKNVGRVQTERVWNKLSAADRLQALKFTSRYKELRPDKKYRKNPENYLTGRVWEDDLSTYKTTRDNKGSIKAPASPDYYSGDVDF